MPGNATYVIDQTATYQTVILMGCQPREKFGQPGTHEVTADGTPRWTIGAATTSHPVNGMPAASEVVNVTIAAAANPCDGISPGAQITFDQLRVGVSPPEKREDGKLRGGKPFYSAAGVRSAVQSYRKSDAA